MKPHAFPFLTAIALLVGSCATVPVDTSVAPRPGATVIDASLIPPAEWPPTFTITTTAFVAPRDPAKRPALQPIQHRSALYHDVRRASELSSSPMPRIHSPIQYPFRLAQLGVTGRVLVAFVVDAKGRVAEPKVIEADDKEFAERALDGVRQWLFVPGRSDGTPSPCLLVQEITFAGAVP